MNSRATSWKDATGQLQFDRALEANDPRWYDLSDARGDKAVERVRRLLDRHPRASPVHVVLASHRGAGKSTEIRRLTHALNSRYHTIHLAANEEMDPERFEMDDLLLMLAIRVEAEMRNLGLPLDNALLEKVASWFRDEVVAKTKVATYSAEATAEASIGAKLPFFASLLGKLGALYRVESEHRSEVKEIVRKYPGTLLAHVNALLNAATDKLSASANHGSRELLVVIDNMDRYNPDHIDELLVRGGDRFRELRCSLILTPPITLVYRPKSGSLDDHFRVFVMPTVKTRSQTDPYDRAIGAGRQALLGVLDKRIDVARLLPDEPAVDRLLAACGGGVRDLLEFTFDLALECDGATATLADVERVVARRRARMRDVVNSNGFADVLAEIATAKQISENDACLAVLHYRLAFHYNQDFWYDIHPEVSRIPEVSKRIRSLGGSTP